MLPILTSNSANITPAIDIIMIIIWNMISLLNFVLPDTKVSKPVIKDWQDAAAFASISASQRIFLARNCKDWHTN